MRGCKLPLGSGKAAARLMRATSAEHLTWSLRGLAGWALPIPPSPDPTENGSAKIASSGVFA